MISPEMLKVLKNQVLPVLDRAASSETDDNGNCVSHDAKDTAIKVRWVLCNEEIT